MKAYSKLRLAQTFTFNGVKLYDLVVLPDDILDGAAVIKVGSNHAGKPHLISEYYYGTVNYDWVLILANNVAEPMNWPALGETIKIPDRAKLVSSLL